MGKPGKSFNTWVKVYFSSHESVMRVCPMGWAPPHTDTDSASRLWAVSKSDCLKQRVRVLALSLLCSWTLLLLPPTRARLTWKPVRWTLALKPTIWRSPRLCQSRNIAEPTASTPWFQHGSPVTSRNSDASQQRFPEQHVETHVRNETKDRSNMLNSRGKQNQRPSLLIQQKQVTN